MGSLSIHHHSIYSATDISDSTNPLAVFFRNPFKPFTLVGLGAVVVNELSEAHVIADPGINLVIVRRHNWKGENLDKISKMLLHLHDTSANTTLHSTWNSTESDYGACIPNRLAHHFGRQGAELALEGGFSELVRDIFGQISFLQSVSCAQKIFMNTRFSAEAPDITKPSKHIDDQFLTMGCAYLGGGTVCELANSDEIQLEAGEIGIWKGKVVKKSNMLIEEADNDGQPLVHWTPYNPRDYPRFVSLIDAYDDNLPDRLLKFQSFVPWKIAL